MSVAYKTVQWNKHKRVYDLWLIAGMVLYLAGFMVVSKLTWAAEMAISDEVLIMRGTATLAYGMLHVILMIGPMARLDRRFLPLLYNRRHFGVAMFVVALVHAFIAIGFYHGFGVVNPLISLFTSNTQYGSLTGFPFETLGVVALIILFFMAATSHDFWLKNLSPVVWKRLHMLVYVAFGLLVMHVALGALQAERSVVYPVLVIGGVVLVTAVHIAAGLVGRADQVDQIEWVDAGVAMDIADGRAVIVRISGGPRIAVFRHGDKVSAMSNVCAHQGGPLGEGKIVDGCVTCPWHGYQYRPEDGQSPPPYTEKIPTFRVKVEDGRVWIDPRPLAPGTPVEPAVIGGLT